MTGGREMYSNKPIEFVKDRRNRPDPLNQVLDAMTLVVWLMLMFSVAVSREAMPQVESFFHNIFNLTLRENWDTELLFIARILMAVLFFGSLLCIWLNTKRLKRVRDRFRISFVITAVGSLFGFVFLFFAV